MNVLSTFTMVSWVNGLIHRKEGRISDKTFGSQFSAYITPCESDSVQYIKCFRPELYISTSRNIPSWLETLDSHSYLRNIFMSLSKLFRSLTTISGFFKGLFIRTINTDVTNNCSQL